MELWKDIKGYEGIYKISNHGKILSFKRNKEGKQLTEYVCNIGYTQYGLSKHNKTIKHYGHRLVAEHFIDNPENKKCVNHKDGNKANNHIDNLEWCTHTDNNIHAVQSGLHKRLLTPDQVREIRRIYVKGMPYKKNPYSYSALAKIYNVSRDTIYLVVKRKAYANVT